VEDEYADRVYVPGTNATPPPARDVEEFWPPEELDAPANGGGPVHGGTPVPHQPGPSVPLQAAPQFGPSPQFGPAPSTQSAFPHHPPLVPPVEAAHELYRPADRAAPGPAPAPGPPPVRPQPPLPHEALPHQRLPHGAPVEPPRRPTVEPPPNPPVHAVIESATQAWPNIRPRGSTDEFAQVNPAPPVSPAPETAPDHHRPSTPWSQPPQPRPVQSAEILAESGPQRGQNPPRSTESPAPQSEPERPSWDRSPPPVWTPAPRPDDRTGFTPPQQRTPGPQPPVQQPPVQQPMPQQPVQQPTLGPPPPPPPPQEHPHPGPVQHQPPAVDPVVTERAAYYPTVTPRRSPETPDPQEQVHQQQVPHQQVPQQQVHQQQPHPTVGPYPPAIDPRQQEQPRPQPPLDPYNQVPWTSDGTAPTAEEFARRRLARPAEPVATMGPRALLQKGTMGLVKLAPGRREQEYKQDVEMVRRNFGGLRQVTVVNPKGGAGKTVAVLLLAMTFGQKRGGYVLAWDNNETQGTLGMRAQQDFHARTVRDMMRDLDLFRGSQGRVGDLSQYVRAQGEGMFDVLASDESATAGEMLTANAFGEIREIVSRFYKLIFVDTGNNVRAQNWQAAMDATDQLVITMSARNDSAETAARMLDHLEQSGRQRLVRQAISIVSMPPTRKDIDLPAIQRHFAARTRAVLISPYEKLIDSGEPLRYGQLSADTRHAWLKIAAAVAEGL
jgi:MinD-like ATPase involved in chromosome partitioning or flagellar assembly